MRTLIALLLTASCFLLAAPIGRSSELTVRRDVQAVIHQLQPSLNNQDTLKLARALAHVVNGGTCEISWDILLSVAFTESSLQKNKIGILNPRTKDYGLMQVTEEMVLRLHLDRAKLLRDEEYSFKIGCQILTANKQKYAEAVPYWLGLYRSGTRIWRASIRRNAIAYDTMIRRRAGEILSM